MSGTFTKLMLTLIGKEPARKVIEDLRKETALVFDALKQDATKALQESSELAKKQIENASLAVKNKLKTIDADKEIDAAVQQAFQQLEEAQKAVADSLNETTSEEKKKLQEIYKMDKHLFKAAESETLNIVNETTQMLEKHRKECIKDLENILEQAKKDLNHFSEMTKKMVENNKKSSKN